VSAEHLDRIVRVGVGDAAAFSHVGEQGRPEAVCRGVEFASAAELSPAPANAGVPMVVIVGSTPGAPDPSTGIGLDTVSEIEARLG
jgi:hypothetical protein